MADDDDHTFEKAEAGASATYPMQVAQGRFWTRIGHGRKSLYKLFFSIGFQTDMRPVHEKSTGHRLVKCVNPQQRYWLRWVGAKIHTHLRPHRPHPNKYVQRGDMPLHQI